MDWENRLINELIAEYVTDKKLQPSIAKLYSQYTRKRYNQPSLKTWSLSENSERFSDAVRLLDLGLLAMRNEYDGWRELLSRSGQIFEWLSGLEENQGIPLSFIAAATYQIAGYPALAMGVLKEEVKDTESKILRDFLSSNFKSLFERLPEWWKWEKDNEVEDDAEYSRKFTTYIVSETIKCFGVFCSELRWGNEARFEKSLLKFQNLKELFLFNKDPFSVILIDLCSELMSLYVKNSVRNNLAQLTEQLNSIGKTSIEYYSLSAFGD